MDSPSSSSSNSAGTEADCSGGSTPARLGISSVDGDGVAGGSSDGEATSGGNTAADAMGRPVAKTGKGGRGGCSKRGGQEAISGAGPVDTSGSGWEWEEETFLRLLRFRGILVGGGG